MRKFFVLICILFITVPAFAYRIDSVLQEPYGSNVSGGTVTMALPKTAKALSSVSVPIYEVTIRAASSNAQEVYIGNSAVSGSTIGLNLAHASSSTGNTVTIRVDDLSKIYINSIWVQSVNYIATLK